MEKLPSINTNKATKSLIDQNAFSENVYLIISNFTNIKYIINTIINEKDIIINEWLEKNLEVNSELKKYNLNDFFKKYFAPKIIDLFAWIVNWKNDIWDCPIIDVLIKMFNKKNIWIDSIKVICKWFQKTLINLYWKDYLIKSEIKYITDKNLEWLVENFKNSTLKNEEIKKISAIDFFRKNEWFESEIYEYIHDLNDLTDELNHILFKSSEIFINKEIIWIINLLKLYNKILNNIWNDFSKIWEAINILIDILKQIDFNEIDNSLNNSLFIMIKSFILDLEKWKNDIFIDKTASNIHFIDDSVTSNIEQININSSP